MGQRASNLNTPYCDDVACSQVPWQDVSRMFFFHPEGQSSRRNASHPREVLLYIILS